MRASRRLVGGLAIAGAVVLLVPLVALAASGDLDPTFSGDGMQTTDLGSTENGVTVLPRPGGKLLVLARADSNSDVALLQYTNVGNPDPSFGGGDGSVIVSFLGSEDAYNALGVLPGGKIVVAGSTLGSGRRKLAM